MKKRAFRLFVSSTFKDLVEERKLLHDTVFPTLQSYCVTCGWDFRAVDMRWGVNEDAQLNQRTAEICVDEVREAKSYPAPNLLVLIGERYGWVPLPFAIAQDEFEAARDWLQSQRRSDIVELLNRVYQRDDNHLIVCGLRTPADSQQIVAAYTLRSREDDLVDLKDSKAWEKVETRLRDALQAAAQHFHGAGRLDGPGRDKYFLSLTEQEIRNGLVALGAGAGEAAAQTIAWIRTTGAGEPQVRKLSEAVRRALPEANVVLATTRQHTEDFATTVTEKLKAAIDQQIAAVESQAQAPDFALQTERTIHHAFAAERLRVFVGRESNRAAIAAYIAGAARYPLALRGISGSGKSALMARAAADASAAASAKVVTRFVGASAASADQRTLLISIVEDLAALGVAQKPEQWEDDANRFVAQVREVIAGIDQRVVIFVDALDQIRPPYRPAWLPHEIGPNVKIVVSVLDDEAFATEREIVIGLRKRLPPEAFLEIEPLSARDGRDILAFLEREAHRDLQPLQRDFIIERFIAAGASPLYLRIAFDIARRWRGTHKPIERGLAGDVTSLIGQFIDDLSGVHHHEPQLVRRTLGLLAAGRDGLSEGELIAVLSRDQKVMQAAASERFGARTSRLPDSVWVRLKRSLSALLVEKGVEGEPLLHFFHRQVAEVVRARFYQPDKAALHKALATYFDAPVTSDGQAPFFSRRSLSELPYQLFHAQDRTRLDALLTDAAWIDRKIEVLGGTTEIVADYDSFANQTDLLQPLIGRTLRLVSGIIARDPRQRMAQLHGRLLGAAASAERDRFLAGLAARVPDGALIETRPAMTTAGAELARLEAHAVGVSSLAVLPDGRLASAAGDRTIRLWDPATGAETARLEVDRFWSAGVLAALSDGRLASGGRDKTIRLLDPTTGAVVRLPSSHGGEIEELAALPGGRLASGDSEGTIRVWNTSTGAEIACIKNDGGWVRALVALPDGRLASRVGHDKSIRLWDPMTGVETARLEGPIAGGPLAVLPDGRLASHDGDWIIRLWDPATGAETGQFDGAGGGVLTLTALPDGRLASGSNDETLRLWDPATGAEIARFDHVGAVHEIVVLHDGRLASADSDGTIRFWNPATDVETAQTEEKDRDIVALAELPDGCLASGGRYNTIWLRDSATGAVTKRVTVRDHHHGVMALVALRDGRLASGGAEDNSIPLWDLASEDAIVRLQGHSGRVRALSTLPDGRLVSAATDNTVRLWNPTTQAETARLKVDCGWLGSLAVLPDGRLVGGSEDRSIRLWNLATGAEALRIEGHSERVTGVAVLPSGRLASGSSDQTIRLWDAATGAETARLDLDGKVTALIALADGRLLAGDQFGRLHWLAIKGATKAGSVRSPAPVAKPSRVRSAKSAAAAPRPTAPTATSPLTKKALAENNRPPRSRIGLLLSLLILLAGAFAAAVIWGPQFGFHAASDALTTMLAILASR